MPEYLRVADVLGELRSERWRERGDHEWVALTSFYS